jgi:DNA polymerase III subunit delta
VATPSTLPVYLVKGDDPVLTGDAVRDLVADLVGADDPAFAVEELSGDDFEIAAVVEAAQTPPFFGTRRVVVARGIGRFSAQEVAPMVTYLGDPLESTALVLVAGGGQTARALLDAVKKSGHVVDAAAPSGKGRQAWVAAHLAAAPVDFDRGAAALLTEHLGEDVGRLPSLLEILTAAYAGTGTVGEAELEPFLGDAGGVAPWDLTDAIDRGDTATALENLHRLLGAGRHPLVVLASLHNHYTRILRLDGADAADEKAAAALLGLTGSTFPARKALTQARRLGHDAVARAITLLADADLALKGAVEWPDELVLEVLVARLSRLGATSRGTSRGSATAASRSQSRSPRGP